MTQCSEMANKPGHQNGSASDLESRVLLKYYKEHDYFLSVAGILKALSILGCIASSVAVVWRGGCGGALPAVSALPLACAAGSAGLYACLLLLTTHAPLACLYADLILSPVMGVTLLVAALLRMTVCEMTSPIDFIVGPLGIVLAGTVTASAVITYWAVVQLWDAARVTPVTRQAEPTPADLDV